jgi:hypothetical protein
VSSLVNDLPLCLRSVFVIPNYSSLSTTKNAIKFKSLSWFRLLFVNLSPRWAGSCPKVCHVGLLLDNFALSRMILNTSFSPIIIIPLIYQIKIACTFPQNHKLITLLLNKSILSISVEEHSMSSLILRQ